MGWFDPCERRYGMAKPISVDLRERVVRAYEAGGATLSEVASRFEVSRGSLVVWLRQKRERGTLEPLPHSGGNPTQKLFAVHEEALLRYLQEQSDLTNPELVERLVLEFGPEVRVDPSQISRVLERANLTRKKKSSMIPRSTAGKSNTNASPGSSS